jgi:hypothetical protein
MASGPPFVSLGNPARFVNESGESQIARIGTTLKESDDGGATWAALGGGNTIALDDASTNTQPDLFILRHTTSGVAAVGFGGTVALELEIADGSVLRVNKEVYQLVLATPNGSVYIKQDSWLAAGGALAQHTTKAFIAGAAANPFLFFGDTTGSLYGVGRASNQLQFFHGNNLALNFFNSQMQPSYDIAMQSKRIFSARGAPIAVATSITLGTDGNAFPLTAGTGTLNAIGVNGMAAGTWFILECASGITITHNVAGTGATVTTTTLASIVTSGTGRAVWCYYNGTTVCAQG